MVKYQELHDSEKIHDFILTEKMNEKQAKVYISRLGLYLRWRKLPLEEFLETLKESVKKEEKIINEYALAVNSSYASNVRRFVRFLGYKIDSPLSIIRKREKKIFFDTDPAMKRFLALFRNNGYSESHTRRANRSLNEYCLWCGKSPGELAKEEITPEELTLKLLDFKADRITPSEKFGWKAVKNSSWSLKLQAIQYFYLRIHSPSISDLLLTKEKKIRNGEIRGEKIGKRQIITKEEMKQILDSCSNYRQKAIISGLFQSGIAIGDLLNITYGQIKEKITLANPERIPKAITFWHYRAKTNVGFFACFGEATIRYIILHLNERRELYQRDIEDHEFIFADTNHPYSKPNSSALRTILHSKVDKLGLEKIVPHDFRRTFNTTATRTSKLLEHQIRSMMGHLNESMGQVYDVSKEKERLEDYLTIYDECFNLDFDSLKYKSLEQELKAIKFELNDYKDKLTYTETIIKKLLEALPAGELDLSRENLEKAVEK